MNPALDRTESNAFPVCAEDETIQTHAASASALYTSSIEMVTTPDDYPIWKTRKPVVVVIHHGRKAVQHHYYRYLVVSPGGCTSVGFGDLEMDLEYDNSTSAAVVTPMNPLEPGGAATPPATTTAGTISDMALVSTSSETTGSTPVIQWEDPFGSILMKNSRGEASNVSLTSSIAIGQVTKTDYRNLPYRTMDIDVATGRPVLEADEEENKANVNNLTSLNQNGVMMIRMDHFNAADDISFRPYRIREAVRCLNKKRNKGVTRDDILLFSLHHSLMIDPLSSFLFLKKKYKTVYHRTDSCRKSSQNARAHVGCTERQRPLGCSR